VETRWVMERKPTGFVAKNPVGYFPETQSES
jgi:hypothetical protein